MQDLTKGPFAEDHVSNSVSLRKQERRDKDIVKVTGGA